MDELRIMVGSSNDRYTCYYEVDMQTSIYVDYWNKIEQFKNKN